ncbi:hypothetical protein BsWGS_05550 [Bradybaena similaris]
MYMKNMVPRECLHWYSEHSRLEMITAIFQQPLCGKNSARRVKKVVFEKLLQLSNNNTSNTIRPGDDKEGWRAKITYNYPDLGGEPRSHTTTQTWVESQDHIQLPRPGWRAKITYNYPDLGGEPRSHTTTENKVWGTLH